MLRTRTVGRVRTPTCRLRTGQNRSSPRDEELARRDKYDDYGQAPFIAGDVCTPSPGTGSAFPRRFTLDAAIADLRIWVSDGIRAPAAPANRANRRSAHIGSEETRTGP